MIFTAKVTPTTATGTVTFKDGAAILGAAAVSGGTATFSTTSLATGTHSDIAAQYSGDAAHAASASLAITQTVSRLTTPSYGRWMPHISYGTGPTPFSVTTGDFNGDGKLDLATANYTYNGSVSVFLGNGDGTFAAKRDYSVESYAATVVTGDFNGDGRLDLVTGNDYSISPTISVLLGNGDGTFAAKRSFAFNGTIKSMTTCDFNGDGRLDLVIATGGGSVLVLLGNGNGTFAAAVGYWAGWGERSVTTGDFNRDGRVDLAAVDFSTNGPDALSILLGNGNGTFADKVSYGGYTRPVSVVSGDFNGDGKPDLATANDISFSSNYTSDRVLIYLGNGEGTFPNYGVYDTSGAPVAMSVGDFYGDGTLDIVTVNAPDAGTGYVYLLRGTGDGTFVGEGGDDAGNLPHSVAVGDFNGDGRLDYATANANSNSVMVVLNGSYYVTATTVSATPDPSVYEASVTFTATVTPSPSTGTVTFMDGAATLGTATLSGGAATFTTSALAPGMHSVTAVYSNSSDRYADSTSPAITQTVTAVTPLTTVTTVAANPPGSGYGTNVTFTATVNQPFATGTVTFMEGATTLAIATLSGGIASFTTSSLTVGTHASITAVYSGDTNYTASASPAIDQTVVPVTVVSSSSPNSISSYGTNVTFIATIRPSSATGTVTFMDGATPFGTAALSNGTATCSTSSLAPGTHSAITAQYNGDADNGATTSLAITQTVTMRTTVPPLNFAAPVEYGVGSSSRSVAAGDFNGDGRLDLATANEYAGTVSVLLGSGDGTFAVKVDFAIVDVNSVTAGDFNGDGKLDLVTANSKYHPSISVFLGNGDGTFAAGMTFSVEKFPESVATGDFNGDGKLDLVLPNSYLWVWGGGSGIYIYYGDSVSVLLGNGDGTFAAKVDFPVGGTPTAVTTGDFNGDGKLDLATANAWHNNNTQNCLSVLLGNGDGTFAAKVDFSVGYSPVSVTAGDFNGDGRLDLVNVQTSSDAYGNKVSVLSGNGDGTFAAEVNFPGGSNPDGAVTTGDFNGDGRLDLVTANYYNGTGYTVSVMLGNGDATFAAKVDFPVGNPALSLAAGDFNGDGRLDLAAGKDYASVVAVLLGNSAFTLLYSDIATPARGVTLLGTAYTITGTATDITGSGVQQVEVGITPDGGSTVWHIATGTTSWTYHWTLPAAGSYTIQSRATDNNGSVAAPGEGATVIVGNTPVGGGIVVEAAAGIFITFTDVAKAGATIVTRSAAGPEPPIVGWLLSDPLAYHTISTTASFTGPVRVCMTYDETAVQGEEQAMSLLQWKAPAWVNITVSVDTVANTVCGETDTLLPLILVEQDNRYRIRVQGEGGVKAIAAGGLYSVALKNDGTVVAWGSNSNGQTDIPPGLRGVTAIAAGGSHTVALKDDGTVVVWGRDTESQTSVPAGLSGVTAIAAGASHSVALKNDGTVVVWGWSSSGQTAVPAGLSGVKAVAAGGSHSVALKSDGTVVAWGYNDSNQTRVPAGLSGVKAIAAGADFTVALKNDGTVVAWGNSYWGQTTVPAGLSRVTAITAGGDFTVALKDDGTVIAWGGENYYGQVNVPAGLTGVTAIAAGSIHAMALKKDGTVVAWGDNYSSQTTIPAGLNGVTALAAGMFFTDVLKDDGTVVAWGVNGWGKATVPMGLSGVTAIAAGGHFSLALKNDGTVVGWGNGDSGQINVPAGLSGVKAIAAGYDHSLALRNDGSVVAWGGNDHGQASVPTGLSGVTAIAAGGGHTLALKNDGTVVAWGDNNFGQISVPAGLTGVTAIAAGGGHSLALKNDGTVIAWGWNFYGQTRVPAGLTGVTAIAAGSDHSLALKNDGTVIAWGRNDYRQTWVPAGLTGVKAIAAGYDHSLALKSDGTIVGWGNNSSGQCTIVTDNLAVAFPHGAATCETPVLRGGSSFCTIAPDAGYHRSTFKVSGVDRLAQVSGNHYTITNIQADQLVVASFFRDVDSDGDGVFDDLDNCPNLANPGQEDIDGDALGDVCDPLPGSSVLPGNAVDTTPAPGIDLHFDTVTSGGILTVTSEPNPRPVAHFTILPGESFDLGFSGTFTDAVTVCFAYNDTGITGFEDELRLLHWTDPVWEDITVSLDTAANSICGVTTSLFPFAIVFPDADNDGVLDRIDNCPAMANPAQTDTDGDGIGDGCDPCTDFDGDGYSGCEGDCNDADPAIKPGAAEICNDGSDNDCNALTDLDDPACAVPATYSYYFPAIKDNDAIGWENYLTVQAKEPVPMDAKLTVYDMYGLLKGTYIYSNTIPGANTGTLAPNARAAQRPSGIAGGAIEGSVMVETSVPAIASTNCIANYYMGFSIYEAAKARQVHNFPKAYDGPAPPFFQVYMLAQNIYDQELTVTVRLFGKTAADLGHGATKTYTVPAHGTLKVRPDEVAPLDPSTGSAIYFSGSVVITSDLTTPGDGLGPAIPAMCRFEAGGDAIAIYESTVEQPALYFPVIKDGKFGGGLDYQNFVSVVNPSSTTSATITLVLYNKTGIEEGRLANTVILPGGKKTWRPSGLKGTLALPQDFEGSIVVTTDIPVVGQTNTIYPGYNPYGADGFDLLEASMPAPTLFFPKVYDNLLGAGTGATHLTDNFVYIQNPDATARSVVIDLYNSNGTLNRTMTVGIAPNATHVFRPKDLVTDGSGVFRGSVRVTETSGLPLAGGIKYEVHQGTSPTSAIGAMTIYRSMGQ